MAFVETNGNYIEDAATLPFDNDAIDDWFFANVPVYALVIVWDGLYKDFDCSH